MKRLWNLWMMVACLWAVPGQAALLAPWTFTSLGTLNTSDASPLIPTHCNSQEERPIPVCSIR